MLCATQTVAQSVFPTVFPQPILVVDRVEVFNDSKLGQAMRLVQAEQRTILLQEGRQVNDAFEAEEQRLTEIRSEVSVDEFQILSEGFDVRVQAARQAQRVKDLDMQQAIDGLPNRFFAIAAPFLSKIMSKYQASAIIDKRSVLLFNVNMDITEEIIQILDRAFAQNPNLAIVKE